MGTGSWDAKKWDTYRTEHVAGKASHEVFTARRADAVYDPAKIAMRESRDSSDNPVTTPIFLASDVTGSMGKIADRLMDTGLNTLCTEIYDRKIVPGPSIMTGAIGDFECDTSPLQVSQFEADIRIAEQTRAMWIERGGGANSGESYSGPHLFAAMKTSHDSFEKRRKKGYLITIGDEPNLPVITRAQAKKFLGIDLQADISSLDCVKLASRTYEIFHVILMNEGHARHDPGRVLDSWERILPQRLIKLDDYTKLAEAVVSAIQVTEGASKDYVASTWKGSTGLVVASAIKDLATSRGGGIVTL